MNRTDYALGILLAAAIAPVAIFPGAHWFVIACLILAAAVFVFFVVPAPRERCKRCGHYFNRTIYNRYLKRVKVRQCGDCQAVTQSDVSARDSIAA